MNNLRQQERRQKLKIKNDKYYTDLEVVEKCWGILKETIDFNDVSEIIESSAGAGAWLDKIKSTNIPYIAYDIEPEHNEVIKQDFLTLDIDYKRGRLIGFNFPFGRSNNLSIRFFKKCVGIADYICSIQPISQLNNTYSMYEFDLIKSVDIGKAIYTDRELHCCFNIWKRPRASIEAWEAKYAKQIKVK